MSDPISALPPYFLAFLLDVDDSKTEHFARTILYMRIPVSYWQSPNVYFVENLAQLLGGVSRATSEAPSLTPSCGEERAVFYFERNDTILPYR